jgi:hypothetical protein
MKEWVCSIGVLIKTEKTKVLGEKPVTVPLYPPQIPHGLPAIQPEPPQWEANNLLSHGTALLGELNYNGYYRNRLWACEVGRMTCFSSSMDELSGSILLLLLQSALQPLVGFRPAQLSLNSLSRKVLQSAVASGTSNPQLGGFQAPLQHKILHTDDRLLAW